MAGNGEMDSVALDCIKLHCNVLSVFKELYKCWRSFAHETNMSGCDMEGIRELNICMWKIAMF